MSGAPEADRPTLRDRLVVLRAELRQRLAEAETLEPAWLRMLADAEVVLAAIEREVAA